MVPEQGNPEFVHGQDIVSAPNAQLFLPFQEKAVGFGLGIYKNAVFDTNEKDSSRHTILKNTLKSRAFTGLPVHPAEL